VCHSNPLSHPKLLEILSLFWSFPQNGSLVRNVLSAYGTFLGEMSLKSAEGNAATGFGHRAISGTSERRARVRSKVHWPVSFLKGGAESSFVTTIQNLSSGGFYCFSPFPLRPGEIAFCLLEVPALWNSTTLAVECRAKVIRIEPPNEAGVFGVGCEIEDYRFPRVTGRRTHC
jgi:hypothetical protein